MSPSPLKDRKMALNALSIALGAGVAISVLLWLFQTVSFGEVVSLVVGCQKGALLAFFAISLATSFFRMWRYRILLGGAGFWVRADSLFLVVLVRNFFSDLLPARLGSLIYVFLVTARLGVPLDAASSTFGLAFFFDLLGLVPLVLCAALAADIDPYLLLLVAAGVGIASLLVILKLDFLLRLLAVPVRRFDGRPFAKPLARFLMETAQGVEDIKAAGVLFQAFVLSVIVRGGKYLALYLFLYALLAPEGYTFARLPFPTVFIGLLIPEIAASLPISGIAGIGAYEGAWVYTFRLLGFPVDVAKTTSLSHHLFTQLYGYSIGIIALLVILLPFFASTLPARRSPPRQTLFDFCLRLGISLVTVTIIAMLLFRLPG